jgi:hypothetical protein
LLFFLAVHNKSFIISSLTAVILKYIRNSLHDLLEIFNFILRPPKPPGGGLMCKLAIITYDIFFFRKNLQVPLRGKRIRHILWLRLHQPHPENADLGGFVGLIFFI